MTESSKEELKALFVSAGVKFPGNNYLGFCPFHENKNTPALLIGNDGRYHCQSCGAWGDLEDAKKRLGFSYSGKIQSTVIPEKKKKRRATTKSIRREAFQVYYKLLLEQSRFTAPAREYLASRKIKEIGLLYISDHYSLNWELFKHYSKKKLLDIGILRETSRGKCYAPAQNKIIIPWLDGFGNLDYLQFRTLPNDKYCKSKYSNLGENIPPLYCYNWENVENNKRIYVHEGALNSLVFNQRKPGLASVAIPSATSSSSIKALIELAKSGKEIFLIPDNDQAGEKLTAEIKKAFKEAATSQRLFIRPVSIGKDYNEFLINKLQAS